jgi:serine/threonine protein kinase
MLELEYCQLDLAQLIQQKRRQNVGFSEAEVVLVLADVLKAIQALHMLGYAHMDIKPGKLLYN